MENYNKVNIDGNILISLKKGKFNNICQIAYKQLRCRSQSIIRWQFCI